MKSFLVFKKSFYFSMHLAYVLGFFDPKMVCFVSLLAKMIRDWVKCDLSCYKLGSPAILLLS